MRIKVVAVKARKLVGKLEHDFSSGRGEAEAIALAAVKQGPCVIWSLVEGCCWPLKNTATEKFRWASCGIGRHPRRADDDGLEFGVESRIEKEEYLAGLQNLVKAL